jgi:hypothetical protein
MITLINPFMVFSPRKLSPRVWIDFADTSTVTVSSGAVSSVNDKSSNGINFSQGIANNRPLYTSNVQNGLHAAYFDGTNDSLSSNAATITGTGGIYTTVMLVDRSNNSFFFSQDGVDSAEANRGHQFLRSFAASITGVLLGGANLQLPTRAWSTRSIIATRFGLGTNQAYSRVNGVNGTTTTSLSRNQLSRIIDIGYVRRTNSLFMTGYVYEIIHFNYALSEFQLQQVEGYLTKKWGL